MIPKMKNPMIRTFLSVAIALTFCWAAQAQKVYVNSTPANFPASHTYAWGTQTNPNQIADSILAQEAMTQVNQELQNQGLTMVLEDKNPDLIVVLSGKTKEQTSYNMWGPGIGWGAGWGTITPETNLEGVLVIDIYDAKAKQLVWRGVAQDTLNQKDAGKNMEAVDKAVDKMFKDFPSPTH